MHALLPVLVVQVHVVPVALLLPVDVCCEATVQLYSSYMRVRPKYTSGTNSGRF